MITTNERKLVTALSGLPPAVRLQCLLKLMRRIKRLAERSDLHGRISCEESH